MAENEDKPLIEEMPTDPFAEKSTNSSTKSTSTKRKSSSTPSYREGKITEGLTQLYTVVGSCMIPFDSVCGTNVIENAETMASSLDKLARDNLAVRRALMKVIEGSAWGAVIAAHGPVLMGAFFHHAPQVKEKQKAKEETKETWQTSVA